MAGYRSALTDLRRASRYVAKSLPDRERAAMTAEIPPDDIPLTGTVDDEDPYDESENENEAPVRETDELTELPEEMEYDDEDDLPHPEDDDADEADEDLDEDDEA
jgi:hypothetical protein